MKTSFDSSRIASVFAAGFFCLGALTADVNAQVVTGDPFWGYEGLPAPPPPASSAPQAQLPADLAAIASATDAASTEKAFAEALALRGQDATVYDVYVNRMLSLGQIESLRQPAQTLVQLNGQSGLGWALVGFFKGQDGIMGEAFADTVRATELAPEDPYVLQLAGQLAAWHDFQSGRVALSSDIRQAMVQLNRFADKAPFIDGYNAAMTALREQERAEAAAAATPTAQPYAPEIASPPSVIYQYYPQYYPVYLDPYPNYYSYYPYGFRYPQLFTFFSFTDGFRHHGNHHRYRGDWWGRSWWKSGRWGDRDRWDGRRGGDWTSRRQDRDTGATALAAPALTGEQILRDPVTRSRWQSRRSLNARTTADSPLVISQQAGASPADRTARRQALRTGGGTAQLQAQRQAAVTAEAIRQARRPLSGGSATAVDRAGARAARRTVDGDRVTTERRLAAPAAGTPSIRTGRGDVRRGTQDARTGVTARQSGTPAIDGATARTAREAARDSTIRRSGDAQAAVERQNNASAQSPQQAQPQRTRGDSRRIGTAAPTRQFQPQRSGSDTAALSTPAAPSRQVQPQRSTPAPRVSAPAPRRQVQPQRSTPAPRVSAPAPRRQVQPQRSSAPPRVAAPGNSSRRPAVSAPRGGNRPSAPAARSGGGGRGGRR
ncbi:MAG: hypothetical protein ABFD92_05070 [Planctomycetaceae bacterium]